MKERLISTGVVTFMAIALQAGVAQAQIQHMTWVPNLADWYPGTTTFVAVEGKGVYGKLTHEGGSIYAYFTITSAEPMRNIELTCSLLKQYETGNGRVTVYLTYPDPLSGTTYKESVLEAEPANTIRHVTIDTSGDPVWTDITAFHVLIRIDNVSGLLNCVGQAGHEYWDPFLNPLKVTYDTGEPAGTVITVR